jgi:hypothetical protein
MGGWREGMVKKYGNHWSRTIMTTLMISNMMSPITVVLWLTLVGFVFPFRAIRHRIDNTRAIHQLIQCLATERCESESEGQSNWSVSKEPTIIVRNFAVAISPAWDHTDFYMAYDLAEEGARLPQTVSVLSRWLLASYKSTDVSVLFRALI